MNIRGSHDQFDGSLSVHNVLNFSSHGMNKSCTQSKTNRSSLKEPKQQNTQTSQNLVNNLFFTNFKSIVVQKSNSNSRLSTVSGVSTFRESAVVETRGSQISTKQRMKTLDLNLTQNHKPDNY